MEAMSIRPRLWWRTGCRLLRHNRSSKTNVHQRRTQMTMTIHLWGLTEYSQADSLFVVLLETVKPRSGSSVEPKESSLVSPRSCMRRTVFTVLTMFWLAQMESLTSWKMILSIRSCGISPLSTDSKHSRQTRLLQSMPFLDWWQMKFFMHPLRSALLTTWVLSLSPSSDSQTTSMPSRKK